MNRHIPQATIDEARDELRFRGGRISPVSERLGIPADQLARMIGLPRLQAIPGDDGEDSDPCIFEGSERLQAVM